MPDYVRNFSEGLIDQNRYRLLTRILSAWLLDVAKKHYEIKGNLNTTESPK